MKPDLVSIVEAAYFVEQHERDEQWLEALLERVRPALDRGLGVAGYFTDFAQPSSYGFSPIGIGCPEGWREVFEVMTGPDVVTPEILRRLGSSQTVVTLSTNLGKRLYGTLKPALERVAHPRGVRDWLGIKVCDPTARGVIISALLPRISTASRATIASWSRVAAHIAAGYRLRRRLAAPPEGVARPDWLRSAEAVLEPERCKLEHAEGLAKAREARDALLFATRQMERARGRLRRVNPDEAVAIWLGLVAGRWTLVEQCERDGRRYLLAYRNDPRTAKRSRLSERERQVLGYAALGHANKLIAYELGVAPSTVSTALARAQTKLGASSRRELLALYRAAAGAQRSKAP